MKSQTMYRVGKIITAIGSFIEYAGNEIAYKGRILWEKNCTCEKCKENKEG